MRTLPPIYRGKVYQPTMLLHSYGLVFDSSIPFIKFQNYSQVHFKKRSFVIVKNEIDSIDINFIKVVKID